MTEPIYVLTVTKKERNPNWEKKDVYNRGYNDPPEFLELRTMEVTLTGEEFQQVKQGLIRSWEALTDVCQKGHGLT